jgi:valyl-tRNA synthetase
VGVEEKAVVPIELRTNPHFRKLVEQNLEMVERLARISEVRFVNEISPGLSKYAQPAIDLAVVYEKTIDVAAERTRHQKDIAQNEKIITNADRQLNNPGFVEKAPPHIVEGLKQQRDEAKRLLDKARGDLDALPE